MVSTLKAASLPMLPFDPGISNHRLLAAVPPAPCTNGTSRAAISKQDWLRGIIREAEGS